MKKLLNSYSVICIDEEKFFSQANFFLKLYICLTNIHAWIYLAVLQFLGQEDFKARRFNMILKKSGGYVLSGLNFIFAGLNH